ncbi:MAG: glycine-rich domain-containing protein [Thiomonas sp.]
MGVAFPANRQQVFTASGTFTPSDKLLQRGGWVHVFLVGGGGGGGVQNYYSSSYYFKGGGGGQVVSRIVQVTGPVTVTIGAGGVGGTSPTDGGDSSFGSLLTAKGGKANGRSGNELPSAGYGGSGAGGGGGLSLWVVGGGDSTYYFGIPGGPGVNGFGCGGVSGNGTLPPPSSPPEPNSGNGGSWANDGASGICIVSWFE